MSVTYFKRLSSRQTSASPTLTLSTLATTYRDTLVDGIPLYLYEDPIIGHLIQHKLIASSVELSGGGSGAVVRKLTLVRPVTILFGNHTYHLAKKMVLKSDRDCKTPGRVNRVRGDYETYRELEKPLYRDIRSIFPTIHYQHDRPKSHTVILMQWVTGDLLHNAIRHAKSPDHASELYQDTFTHNLGKLITFYRSKTHKDTQSIAHHILFGSLGFPMPHMDQLVQSITSQCHLSVDTLRTKYRKAPGALETHIRNKWFFENTIGRVIERLSSLFEVPYMTPRHHAQFLKILTPALRILYMLSDKEWQTIISETFGAKLFFEKDLKKMPGYRHAEFIRFMLFPRTIGYMLTDPSPLNEKARSKAFDPGGTLACQFPYVLSKAISLFSMFLPLILENKFSIVSEDDGLHIRFEISEDEWDNLARVYGPDATYKTLKKAGVYTDKPYYEVAHIFFWIRQFFNDAKYRSNPAQALADIVIGTRALVELFTRLDEICTTFPALSETSSISKLQDRIHDELRDFFPFERDQSSPGHAKSPRARL